MFRDKSETRCGSLIHGKLRKAWLGKIKEDLNKRKEKACLEVKRFSIKKLSLILKLIYRFKIIPIKIVVDFLFSVEAEK